MSFPPDIKKAYGLVAAIGSKLGEKARADAGVVPALRAPEDADAFRIAVRLLATGLLRDDLLEQFLQQVVTDDEWEKWRARLLVQVKMTRDGGKPAPGHEQGRGVGGP